MKKALMVSVAVLASLSLAACGSSSSNGASSSSTKTTKVTKHKATKKSSSKKASSSSASSSSASGDDSSSSSASVESSSSTASSSSAAASSSSTQATQASQAGPINSPDAAIAAARAKYGDNGGDYHWVAMQNGDSYTNPDGSYFVKAISQQQLDSGSMTGTAVSVMVYPDGTVSEN